MESMGKNLTCVRLLVKRVESDCVVNTKGPWKRIGRLCYLFTVLSSLSCSPTQPISLSGS